MGLTLKEAHSELLNSYQKLIENDLWHRVPDDGYIHSYLAWHMEQADCREELHKLLKEETDEGKNGWYQARERLDQVTGYLADVTRAWKLAKKDFNDCQSSSAISLQIRYALITASLNSLAKNMPPALIAALVDKKIWTVTQGLAYARQTPEPTQKAEALVRLTHHLPESEQKLIQKEALTIVLAIEHPDNRGKALAKLAAYQPKSIQEKALTAVQAIDTDWWKGEAIAGLAPHFPKSLARNILSVVRTINNEYIQDYTLARIWSFLPTSEFEEITQNLQSRLIEKFSVLSRTRERCGLDQYINLIYKLPQPFQRKILPKIFRVMEQNNSGLLPDYLYMQLVNYLPEERLEEVNSILRQANGTEPRERYRLFPELIRLLYDLPELYMEIQEHFESIVDDTRQSSQDRIWETELEKLRELEKQLNQSEIEQPINQDLAITEDESQQAEVLATIWNIADESERTENLTRLVPHLSKALLPEALVGVQKIQDKTEQVQVLVNFAPYLSEALRKETLKLLLTVQNENLRVEMLVDLAPNLSEPLLGKVLNVLPAIKDESKRGEFLIELTPHLPESLLNQALEIARAIQENPSREQILLNRERILLKMVPRLPESLQHTVMNDLLATVLKIENDKKSQAEKLTELGCQLPKSLNMYVLKDALALTKEIADVQQKEKLLKKLIPHLSDSLLESILPLVRNSENKYLHALTIVYLAPQSNPLLLEEGLDAAQEIHRIEERRLVRNSETDIQNQKAEILEGLAPYLMRDSLRNKALEVAQEIQEDLPKVKTLEVLARYLPESMKENIFREEVLAKHREQWQTMAFTQLASYFPQSLTDEALRVAQENIESKWNKLKIIKVPIQHNLNNSNRLSDLLQEAVATAKTIEIEEGQAGAMIEIFPYISNEQKIEVIKKVLTNENKKSRAAQIKILAPYISEMSSNTFDLVWSDTLHFLARRSRKDLLSDLYALTPVIKSLGQTQAIEEIASAIQDVGRWWS